jgi:hypothetical protein
VGRERAPDRAPQQELADVAVAGHDDAPVVDGQHGRARRGGAPPGAGAGSSAGRSRGSRAGEQVRQPGVVRGRAAPRAPAAGRGGVGRGVELRRDDDVPVLRPDPPDHLDQHVLGHDEQFRFPEHEAR